MSIFREYDIRGIFESELNEESVMLIGYALSKKISGKSVSIGYDARTHSPYIFKWLADGLNRGGKQVLDMGMVPTPVNYFSGYHTFETESGPIMSDASIMITGSHNPPEYNGFKITVDRMPFFGESIYRLRDEVEGLVLPGPVETDIVKIDAVTPYIERICEEFGHLSGLDARIVYDCGNGTAGIVLPEIFERLDLNTDGIFIEPDGNFPNHHPDPSVEANLDDIKRKMRADNADLAFAYDGDADRLAVLTRKHNIKGDQMAVLFAMNMKDPVVIGEVKCSQLMYDVLEKRGAKAVMYKTGHSNLKVKIRELNADMACEVSGHIFFNDRYFGYDDAIYATLRMLELIAAGIDPDTEIEKLDRIYSTDEIKIETSDSEKFILVEKLKELLGNPPEDFPPVKNIIDIDGVRVVFENGWGLIRPSNTTPVLVARFESADEEDMRRYQEAMVRLLKKAASLLRR